MDYSVSTHNSVSTHTSHAMNAEVRDSQRQALRKVVVVPIPETEQSTSKSAGYRCAQCCKKHQLTMKDSVRCSECGYRVMYKLRDSALCMRYLAR